MWGDMKPMLKSQEEIPDYFPPTPRKDWSISLVKVVTILVIFMAGVVIGLSISASFGRYYNSQTDLFFPSTMYTSSCDKDCLNFKSFVKPSNLMHTMTDQQLYWRASLVPKMEEFPFNRVPKVAFLFMTRGPLPFAPLWDRFFKGHTGLYSVYVHTLPDYKLNVSTDSVFYGRQIPSEEVSWGSITLVDAEKRLLANALLDFSNERFVLVSESCIPVYNFPTVYRVPHQLDTELHRVVLRPDPAMRGAVQPTHGPTRHHRTVAQVGVVNGTVYRFTDRCRHETLR